MKKQLFRLFSTIGFQLIRLGCNLMRLTGLKVKEKWYARGFYSILVEMEGDNYE